jgi:mRNA-degrading endonuclease RelE of RelBE toxin-antitoxin system
MKYTVFWAPKAEAKLATLWMTAPDPAQLASAANSIDRHLKFHPYDVGTHQFDSVWTMVSNPLGVTYEIKDDDKVVHVLNVWNIHLSPETNI